DRALWYQRCRASRPRHPDRRRLYCGGRQFGCRAHPAAAKGSSLSITLMVEDKKWSTKRGLGARLKKAAALALARGKGKGALTVLLSSDRKLHTLNVTFRGKDKATNVLSFPAQQDEYLGDVAVAYGVTA